MSSWSNENKTAGFSPSNEAKNSATIKNQLKAGSAQKYDDVNYEYDQDFDPISGNPVFYDGVGTLPVITNLTKN